MENPPTQEELLACGNAIMQTIRQCQIFMDRLTHIPCLRCNSPNSIFYDENSYLSHIFENHILNDTELNQVQNSQRTPQSNRVIENEGSTPQIQDPQPSTSGVTKSNIQGRKILKTKRRQINPSIKPESCMIKKRKVRTYTNHDQGCLCMVEGTHQTVPGSENKSVQTATPTKSEKSTQTGRTNFGQEIQELEENDVVAMNESDLLAHKVDHYIETTERATQTENEPPSSPLELEALQESLIVAVNERDLFVEENENLEQRLEFLTQNFDERLVEDYEVLYQVNEQMKKMRLN